MFKFKVFVSSPRLDPETYCAGEFARMEDAQVFGEEWYVRHKSDVLRDGSYPFVFIEDRYFASEVRGVPNIYILCWTNHYKPHPNGFSSPILTGVSYKWELRNVEHGGRFCPEGGEE